MQGIRHIVVGLDTPETARAPLATAFLIAQARAAHVQAVHARPAPANLRHLREAGLPESSIASFREAAVKAEVEQGEACRAIFEEMRATYGLPESGAGVPPGPDGASARFLALDGDPGAVLTRRGRGADLVVLGRGRGHADPAAASTFQGVLTSGARPVVVAPETAPETVGHSVVVAWNDSAEAMRALTAALPLLVLAPRVTVVRVVDRSAEEDGDVSAAVEYLGWHGISCSTDSVRRVDGAGASLLRACDAHEADLLVMGASTHSRLRELVIGGATRHILRHATLPVLVAH
jgi:nucleotide-binding universal stress UspA family protein